MRCRYAHLAGALLALLALTATASEAQHAASARDMQLVGHHDLQSRSAYQPVIHHQGNRFIALCPMTRTAT